MKRCSWLYLVITGAICACSSSEPSRVVQLSTGTGTNAEALLPMPESVRNMPELWKEYHGWFDNELTARYEQWLQGWVEPEAQEQGIGDQGEGDVRMSNPSFSGNQNEFQIAINPVDSRFAIGTSNDARHAGVGIYATSDSGLTWSAQDAPLGGASGCCDPAVVYAQDGIAYVGILGGIGAYTLRSDDNGNSWQLMTSVVLPDRNNLVVDPRDSNVIMITYSDLPATNRIKGYRSTDGGATWGPSFFIGGPAPVGGYEQSSQPRIANDGTIYVGFQQYLNSGLGCAGGVQNVLAKSTDDGQTFTQTVLDMVQGGACTPGQAGRGIFCINLGGNSFRSRSHPIIGVDPVDSTIVYMVYSGGDLELPYRCAGADGFHSYILFRKSVDGGDTFTDPIPINQDGPGSDQYYPWMDVSADGTIWVGWNDRRDDPNNFYSRWYQAFSTDQGQTWTEFPVTDVMVHPGTFIGDYHGMAAQAGLLLGMWFDTRIIPSGDPYTHPGTP